MMELATFPGMSFPGRPLMREKRTCCTTACIRGSGRYRRPRYSPGKLDQRHNLFSFVKQTVSCPITTSAANEANILLTTLDRTCTVEQKGPFQRKNVILTFENRESVEMKEMNPRREGWGWLGGLPSAVGSPQTADAP